MFEHLMPLIEENVNFEFGTCAEFVFEECKIPDSRCDECGAYTKDGKAVYKCSYSPIRCELCKHRPCDQSC
jgi:hypothetical protein